jgi:hypothetical protein
MSSLILDMTCLAATSCFVVLPLSLSSFSSSRGRLLAGSSRKCQMRPRLIWRPRSIFSQNSEVFFKVMLLLCLSAHACTRDEASRHHHQSVVHHSRAELRPSSAILNRSLRGRCAAFYAPRGYDVSMAATVYAEEDEELRYIMWRKDTNFSKTTTA